MTVTMPQPPETLTQTTRPAVRVSKVSKSLDERSILRDVSLDIAAGEYVAILGANGAGKSTLLKLLATLMTPTSGSIELFGKPLVSGNAPLRARIGLIGQDAMLYRELSARENLVFFAKLYSIANPKARVEQMLKMIGLADRAADPVKRFSRGMIQRVSIARALLHEPDLILADEPFAGLDAPSIAALEHLLAKLSLAGKTVVLVNHDIEQTFRLAERLIVLRQGQVVIDNATHRLYAREVLSEVS